MAVLVTPTQPHPECAMIEVKGRGKGECMGPWRPSLTTSAQLPAWPWRAKSEAALTRRAAWHSPTKGQPQWVTGDGMVLLAGRPP